MTIAADAPSSTTAPRPTGVALLAALNGVVAAIHLTLGMLMLCFGAMPPNVDDHRVAMIAGALLAGAGLFHLANGILLWRLRPSGRLLEIIQSAAVWLWVFPIGTIVSAFVLYYLTRPGVKLLFSGQPWPSLTPEARQLVERDAYQSAIVVVIGIVTAVAALFLLGLAASLVFPGLFGPARM
jgi:hypothetical protein